MNEPRRGQVIRLSETFEQLEEAWSPRVVEELNDYQIKVALFEGEFVWHRHEDTDEAFLVLSGAMEIEMGDRTVRLSEGDLFVVPKGVQHRPRANSACY